MWSVYINVQMCFPYLHIMAKTLENPLDLVSLYCCVLFLMGKSDIPQFE